MGEPLPEQWADMRLDSRILEAVHDLKWKAPLAVQRACIPHALRGSDISLQSRTGSGKTGAFAIPMIQRYLSVCEREKQQAKGAAPAKPVGLILVPSLELCEQSVEATQALCKYIKPRVVVDNLCARGTVNDARITSADIIVSTAAGLAKYIKNGNVTEAAFRHVKVVVMDEVDMMIAISERSIRLVQTLLPQTSQGILCSATLTEGVASIKGQLLHNPVHITLTADDADAADPRSKRARDEEPVTEAEVESRITLKDTAAKTLKQYYLVATDECHKHTLLFGLYRLKLMDGKTLIFMDQEDDTYHLEHFLQQLGVACVVYDATLPTNARLDILKRFQRGEVGTLICTDNTLESAERMQFSMEGGDVADEATEQEEDGKKKKKRLRTEDNTPNSALHRGVDFNKVRNVIIFDGMDAPTAINFAKYTHRVGRTGRAGQEGTSILIANMSQSRKVVPGLRDYLKDRGDQLRAFKQMDRREVAKLQYRVDSALANVTRNAARKLRVATVATEIARSSYLATHLTQRDNETLERIVKKSSKSVRCDRNLLDLPKYMEIKKTDNAKSYAERVNLQGPRKEQSFAAVTKRRQLDPLKAVVAKVRNEKRNASKQSKRDASKK